MAALSGVVDSDRLERGLALLEAWGFVPVLAPNLRDRWGIFAGTDSDRLRGLYALADDPSIDAIWFARGGHGVLRILPALDWGRLASRPRAFLGYSDLTPLLLEVVRRCGWVTFHAPMVAADLGRDLLEEEVLGLLHGLAGEVAHLRWPVSPFETSDSAAEEGDVVGPLLGGCLSLLVSTLGTPYALDPVGALLWIEDVGEPYYRLDRMLTQLWLSGSLHWVSGIVIGHLFANGEGDLALAAAGRLRELLPDIPIFTGLPAGHRAPNLLLPLGWPVRFSRTAGALLPLLSSAG